MKRSLKDLSGYTIKTKDGKEGKVKDFIFDDKQWVIRYLEADFGTLFSSKKVLVPRSFFKQPSWDEKVFPTALSTSDIERCPVIQDHMPVSRKYEEELHNHYLLNPYWTTTPQMGLAGIYPPRPVHVPSKKITEDDVDTIIRSYKEIEGYQIHAIDGKIGHVEDILIDDEDWQILYVVTDTNNWLPWSKKLLVAVNWLDTISYVDREVNIRLKTEIIENAPEYNPTEQIDKKYEESLFDFYSRSLIK